MLATAAALGVGRTAMAQTLATVRVGLSQPIFSFLPLDIGVDAGIFARHGLAIEKTVFAGSAKLHQGIAAGGIDVGLGAGPELGFVAKGSPELAVAAIADLPRELDITVLKDGPIKTVADLKGKRLSVSTKGSLTEWGGQELSRPGRRSQGQRPKQKKRNERDSDAAFYDVSQVSPGELAEDVFHKMFAGLKLRLFGKTPFWFQYIRHLPSNVCPRPASA